MEKIMFYVVWHLLGTAKWTEKNSEPAFLTADKLNRNLATNKLKEFRFETISKNN